MRDPIRIPQLLATLCSCKIYVYRGAFLLNCTCVCNYLLGDLFCMSLISMYYLVLIKRGEGGGGNEV